MAGEAAATCSVQTRVPGHEVLRGAATGDLAELLGVETARRRTLGFPPFGGLAELSGAEAAVVDASSTSRRRRGSTASQVFGPSPAGRTLVLAPSAQALADVFARVDLVPARAHGRLRVAVDPPRI